MKCPACGNALTETEAGGIKVDLCDGGCGGIWFDSHEMEKVDERHEHAGEVLLDVRKSDSAKVDFEAPRTCPRCGEGVMNRHFVSVKRRVEIDQCARCNGVWLDAGELGDIRALYDTEAERKKAADEYFQEVFAGDMAEVRAESQAKLDRSRRFARIFRFICPSYYIPGKQEGAAF